MPKIRIIPSILTDGYSQVKGQSFDSWRTVGSVISAAKVFSIRDVDELVLLDVSARFRGKTIDFELVSSLAEFLRVPFSVGGGIDNVKQIELLLSSGADKVVLGTSALSNSNIIEEAANFFGSQAVVCAIDYRENNGQPKVTSHSGSKLHDLHPVELAKIAEKCGAGELLLQNVEKDGTMEGVNLKILGEVSSSVNIPVIASGGVGQFEDFEDLIDAGASAVAAGALFQFTKTTPKEVREHLRSKGFQVRNH